MEKKLLRAGKRFWFGVVAVVSLSICPVVVNAEYAHFDLPNGKKVSILFDSQKNGCPSLRWKGRNAYVGGIEKVGEMFHLSLVYEDGTVKQIRMTKSELNTANMNVVKCPDSKSTGLHQNIQNGSKKQKSSGSNKGCSTAAIEKRFKHLEHVRSARAQGADMVLSVSYYPIDSEQSAVNALNSIYHAVVDGPGNDWIKCGGSRIVCEGPWQISSPGSQGAPFLIMKSNGAWGHMGGH